MKPRGTDRPRAAAWLRPLILLLIGVATSLAHAAPVPVLRVEDAIGPGSADFMIRGIAKAADSGAPLVVIQLDTPGGLDTSMRAIIQAILSSRVPVAVYVSPEGARAASAGTYILYAAHVAAMAPATTLGAATPVEIGLPGVDRKPAPGDEGRERAGRRNGGGAGGDAGEDGAGGAKGQATGKPSAESKPVPSPAEGGDAMTAKRVNDAAAFIRGLAQRRGRNADWAERAVREAVTLTATEALRQNVIDVVANDVEDLLAKIDGRRVLVHGADVTLATRGLPVQVVEPDWRQKFISAIANPSLALILIMIGIYGILFEFASPGFGVSGTVGAICLLLALFALQMLPVNYAGLGLILLGVALLVAEVFTASFGVLGVGGIVAFFAGGLLLFDRDIPGFGVPLWLLIGLAASSALLILAGGSMALRARRRPVVSGREEMVGEHGTVIEPADGGAWVHVHGERWRATSPDALAPGQRVRVVGMHGLTLRVRAQAHAERLGEST